MKVHIPSALQSYTTQRREVPANGDTLADVLASLDQRFPGIRFRIIDEQDRFRPHIRIFVNDLQASHLQVPIGADDQVYIVCALSGG
ncbi:MoaD/ThiS family protein [Petrachloros mirabilis]